jgi:hypothetical protein
LGACVLVYQCLQREHCAPLNGNASVILSDHDEGEKGKRERERAGCGCPPVGVLRWAALGLVALRCRPSGGRSPRSARCVGGLGAGAGAGLLVLGPPAGPPVSPPMGTARRPSERAEIAHQKAKFTPLVSKIHPCKLGQYRL